MANYRIDGFKFNRANLAGLDAHSAKTLNTYLCAQEARINTITTVALMCSGGPFEGQLMDLPTEGEGSTSSGHNASTAIFTIGAWCGRYVRLTLKEKGQNFFCYAWQAEGAEVPTSGRALISNPKTKAAAAEKELGKGFALLAEFLATMADEPNTIEHAGQQMAVFKIGRTTYRVLNTPEQIAQLRAKIIKAKKWFSDKHLTTPTQQLSATEKAYQAYKANQTPETMQAVAQADPAGEVTSIKFDAQTLKFVADLVATVHADAAIQAAMRNDLKVEQVFQRCAPALAMASESSTGHGYPPAPAPHHHGHTSNTTSTPETCSTPPETFAAPLDHGQTAAARDADHSHTIAAAYAARSATTYSRIKRGEAFQFEKDGNWFLKTGRGYRPGRGGKLSAPFASDTRVYFADPAAGLSEADHRATGLRIFSDLPAAAPDASAPPTSTSTPETPQPAGLAHTPQDLKSRVLDFSFGNKGIKPSQANGMLAAVQNKTGRPIFVTNGNFGREQFNQAHAEAKAAGIEFDKMYVFADTATYSGPSITFMRLDESIPNEPTPQDLPVTQTPAAPATPQRTERRHAPTNGQRVAAKNGAWEGWLYKSSNTGKQCMVIYLGQSAKEWKRFSFATREKAIKSLAYYAADAQKIQQEATRRADEKRQRLAAPHGLALGDVLISSWGYDQTNIDYYEVTGLHGKRGVELRGIAQECADTAHMQGVCVPVPGKYISEPQRKLVDQYGGVNVMNASYGRAHKLEPMHTIAGVKCYAPTGWSSYA